MIIYEGYNGTTQKLGRIFIDNTDKVVFDMSDIDKDELFGYQNPNTIPTKPNDYLNKLFSMCIGSSALKVKVEKGEEFLLAG